MDLHKYNISVPRYTSYPTVPNWKEASFNLTGYHKALHQSFWENGKEVSLYIHLPFCESLCTYCGCNTHITKNHSVEDTYITYLLKEWRLYLNLLPTRPIISEVHLGGGTPTFFSPENLKRLIQGIIETGNTISDPKFSFEGHPANTTKEHLQSLYDVGFRRVSFGIQDFDTKVQQLINRKQTYEQVKHVTANAREIGYESINYDLIYGLPGQTVETMKSTFERVADLKPDRIAFYSYAHVPKLKPSQKVFEDQLPSPKEKLNMLKLGKETLDIMGYEEVGMDHYCLPKDDLLSARKEGLLHRNFMGYTICSTSLQIGLGASAISDAWTSFVQNEKTIVEYYKKLDNNELPIKKGHLHTTEDIFVRKHILNLMCHYRTSWRPEELVLFGLNINYSGLKALENEGYLECDETGIKVNTTGRDIIRVICSMLDRDYDSNQNSNGKYSKAF